MADSNGYEVEHHLIVAKSEGSVYLTVDNVEYRLTGKLARQVGDALYKAGCDVEQHGMEK